MTQPPRLHNLLALRSIIYALINIMPSAVALLVMPLITLKIPPEPYGIAGLYLSIIAGLLTTLEYSLILRKAYVRHDQEGDHLSQSMTACISIYSLVIGGLTLAALLLWDWVSSFMPLEKSWMLAAMLTAGMQSFFTLCLSLLQIAQRPKQYCILKLAFTTCYTSFALAALFVFDMSWEGLAYSSVAASFTASLLGGWRIRRIFHVRWLPNKRVILGTLRSVLSLTPFRLALAIFTYAGPFIVVYGMGAHESGLYIFAFQICNAIGLVYEGILTAIVPFMVAHHSLSLTSKHALDVRTRRIMAAAYVGVVCLASLTLAVVAPFIVEFLFPEAYEAAIPIIAWIALARCFQGINRLNQELSFFDTESFRRIALLSLCAAFVYVGVAFMMLLEYGVIGAGMGLAMGHGFWLLTLLAAKPWLIRRRSAD